MHQTTEASRACAKGRNGPRHRLRVMYCAGVLLLALAGCQAGGAVNPDESQPADAAPPEAPATIDPAVTSTGAGATTTTVQPWRDETFSYSGDAAWKSDPHNWIVDPAPWANWSAIHIDRSVTYDGHPTLRYDWPGASASNTRCNSNLAREADYTLPTGREIWIEVVHKFATTFNTNHTSDGGYCGSTAYKFLLPRLKGVSFRIGEILNGHTAHHWWGAHPSPTNETFSANCSGIGFDCRFGYGTGQSVYQASVPGPFWDGQWHVYRIHIKMPAYKREKSGILEIWIDGKLVKRVINQSFISRSGLFSNQFASLALGSNSNSATSRPTSNWWGRLRIWTTNPNW